MISAKNIEFGLDSFVPISVDESGRELSGDVVIRNTVEEAVLADSVGIDSFNIAEHYRQDMIDSAARIIAFGSNQQRQHAPLCTAVTVLTQSMRARRRCERRSPADRRPRAPHHRNHLHHMLRILLRGPLRGETRPAD